MCSSDLGTGVICHGGSSAKAIKNAIRMAHDYVASRLNDKLASQINKTTEFSSAGIAAVEAGAVAEQG